mmetsp:Transcript_103245/g.287368  ORF Transcript_103245/g.287368 Transcript_103245/m.287368 type:complete len:201 (+) Transcript_103245:1-603(+)
MPSPSAFGGPGAGAGTAPRGAGGAWPAGCPRSASCADGLAAGSGGASPNAAGGGGCRPPLKGSAAAAGPGCGAAAPAGPGPPRTPFASEEPMPASCRCRSLPAAAPTLDLRALPRPRSRPGCAGAPPSAKHFLSISVANIRMLLQICAPFALVPRAPRRATSASRMPSTELKVAKTSAGAPSYMISLEIVSAFSFFCSGA